MKSIQQVYTTQRAQVGDGFPIRRAFPGHGIRNVNPFLVLDHAGPLAFPPSDTPKGVDEHPHRGFETVSIVYQGALEHRDSAGNYGKLFEGDVQWMTAASGIVHEEKHEEAFTREGGTLEMIQLWVNLPAKHKMDTPSYQDIADVDIPEIELAHGARLRLIAGEYAGETGAARIHTPLTLGDIRHERGANYTLNFQPGWNAALYVLEGEVILNGSTRVREAHLASLGHEGDSLKVEVVEGGKVLLLTGEPIDEPIATYGPFVMNTQEELVKAFEDYRSGKMGHLA